MTERPKNIRATDSSYYGNERYNSRRHISDGRGEENQIANLAYRGSHRADSLHHTEDQSDADRRNSRVGRHHADQPDDYADRWQ